MESILHPIQLGQKIRDQESGALCGFIGHQELKVDENLLICIARSIELLQKLSGQFREIQ